MSNMQKDSERIERGKELTVLDARASSAITELNNVKAKCVEMKNNMKDPIYTEADKSAVDAVKSKVVAALNE